MENLPPFANPLPFWHLKARSSLNRVSCTKWLTSEVKYLWEHKWDLFHDCSFPKWEGMYKKECKPLTYLKTPTHTHNHLTVWCKYTGMYMYINLPPWSEVLCTFCALYRYLEVFLTNNTWTHVDNFLIV